MGTEQTTAATEEVSAARRAELASRLAAVRQRIADACAAAGRSADEVALMAVTKTVAAADVAALLDLGLDLLGENRVQEATRKVEAVADLRPEARPRWHLIGGLQRNKVRAVARWAEQVESVDSVRLADALDVAVRRTVDTGGRESSLSVLVQYSVDGDPQRSGVPRSDLLRLAEHVAGCAGLRLTGLMAVAPLGADLDTAFADIAAAAAALRAEHPGATTLSAGMSGDLEVAIRHGCDVVRVGTALVGERTLASR
jgi:PLP dependent protein